MKDRLESAFWTSRRAKAFKDAESIQGDASARRYARLMKHDGTTAILVQYPQGQESLFERDLAMNDWLCERGLRTPEILARDLGGGWAVLEDFGPADASQRLARSSIGDRLRLARRLIEPLERMAELPVEGQLPGGAELNEVRLRWELAGFELWFIRAMCDQATSTEISSWLDDLAATIAASPRRICHRDYHLNNLFLMPPGGVGVIDAQDTLVGPDTYDAASLLEERDMPDLLTAGEKREWLAEWALRTKAEDGWLERYRVTQLQRALKVLGTFSRLVLAGRDEYCEWLMQVAGRAATTLASGDAPDGLVSILVDWLDAGGVDAR